MRLLVLALLALPAWAQFSYLNHGKPLLDAHNCYPYKGEWKDRIDRALGTGFPVGIEQDLAWYVDPATGKGRIAVTHTDEPTGAEPTLRDYFFERVRPIVEKALAENDRAHWPLIVVHFDFKSNQAPLLHAVWDLLGEYQGWITTAVKTADPHHLSPFEPKPLLVLTEVPDEQEEVFFNEVPVGAKLRLVRLGPHEGDSLGAEGRARAAAGDAAAGGAAAGAADELPPLVEQLVVRSGGRRTAGGGRVDGGGRPAAEGAGRLCAQAGLLDPVLYAGRIYAGGEQGLGQGL